MTLLEIVSYVHNKWQVYYSSSVKQLDGLQFIQYHLGQRKIYELTIQTTKP